MANKEKNNYKEPQMTKAEKALWLRRRILSDDFPEDILDEMLKMVHEQDRE